MVCRVRAQVVVPAVVIFVTFIVLATGAFWLLSIKSMKAQYQLMELEKHILRREMQTLELQNVEWRYVDEWHAYPVFRLVNTGHASIKIMFAGVYIERCSPIVLPTSDRLVACHYIWWQEGNNIVVRSEDGDDVVWPGETLEITTTRPIPLADLYLQNNTFLTLRILTDEAKVITFRMLGSREMRGGVEINVYLDGEPAKSVRVWLVDPLGRSYEALANNITSDKLAYVIIPTLPPGTYELHLRATSRVTGASREYVFRVTVDPGETESIAVTGSTLGNTSLGQRIFMIDLHHLPEWSAKNLYGEYVWAFDSMGATYPGYNWDYGLMLPGYRNLTVVLLIPPLTPGDYILEVGGKLKSEWRGTPRLLAAFFGPPGNLLLIFNAFNWTQDIDALDPLDVYQSGNCTFRIWIPPPYLAPPDFTLKCRVSIREYKPHFLVLLAGALGEPVTIHIDASASWSEAYITAMNFVAWHADHMIVYNVTTSDCPFCDCASCQVVEVVSVYDDETNTTIDYYTLECWDCYCQSKYNGKFISTNADGCKCSSLDNPENATCSCKTMRGMLQEGLLEYRLLLEAENVTGQNPELIVGMEVSFSIHADTPITYDPRWVYLSLSHIWLLPTPESMGIAAVYKGTIWPGDAYNLTENNITKMSSGIILYMPCDNMTTTPTYTATGGVETWWASGGIHGNYSAVWLPEPGAKINYTFTVNCTNPTGCILYAYALPRYYTVLGANVKQWVRGTLYVDGNATAVADANTWVQMKARLQPGQHNITVVLEHVGRILYRRLGGIDTGLDHVLLVKDRYIVITGLKPGYIVELRSNSGLLLKRVMATSNTVLIDAEEIGVEKFPLQGMIIVYRSG